MSHVAPHRWADLLAGRIDAAERATMERHARACARCQRARERVGRASDSFPALRAQSAPELSWDSVRARVHWAVSKERRAPRPVPRRRAAIGWGMGAAALAVAAGVVLVVRHVGAGEPREPDPHAPLATSPPIPVELVTPPAPLVGLVNRTSGEVMIDGIRPDDLFARKLGAGNALATGDGRVDIQFGDASALALGPRSTLALRRFDAEMIELVVDGTLDVEVAPRAAGQRFVVIAGDHTVEVRGTQFRVERARGQLRVACRHGLVSVQAKDATGAVEIGAARQARLAAGAALSADAVVPLSVDELATLAEATPLRLPLWDPDTLATKTAPLEVATASPREVRVDGVELGAAPLRVRVMPGRHTVEAADSAGRFRRAGWVDVAAPAPGAPIARLEVRAEPPRSAGIAERRRQLRGGIDQPRLARCVRSIAKAGLTGTYVQIELAVDEAGAVGFLNILDTDLPSATARCVREVLADVRFRPGASATWRERIDL